MYTRDSLGVKKAGMGVQRDAPKPYASVPTRASLRASYTCTVAMVKIDLAKTNYENQRRTKDSLTLQICAVRFVTTFYFTL